ncbi:MAG TPA: hypothetical protein VNS09_27920 [Solirubrobacter sp.]|nr:hypothetical protein [Solirubrobacter sp.]
MATLCRAYPSEAAARRAIEDLRAAGLPPQGAQLFTGASRHDLRYEPVGEFVGRAEPQAPVGTFGNRAVRRWRPPGGFAGDPDGQRAGSFADTDRQTLVEHDPSGHVHTHVTSLHGVRSRMRAAGLEPLATDRAIAQMQAGATLVLVEVAPIGPEDVAECLEAAA